MNTLLAGVGLAAITTSAIVAAQTVPQPTFRARVDLVTVDVAVVDRDGEPVGDLTADDFVVTVRGRRRTVVSAQRVTFPQQSSEASASAISTSFSTNFSAAPGRLIVLVVDQANIRMGAVKSLLNTASGFLDRLRPSDRVALVTIPAPGPTVGLTADRARVKAGLERINGFFDPRAAIHNIAVTEAFAIIELDAETLAKVVERECGPRANEPCEALIRAESSRIAETARRRTDDSLRSLIDLFGILKTVDGPKTVVLMSEGLITEQGHDRDHELALLAAQARASVYVMRLEAKESDPSASRPFSVVDSEAQRQGVERIAGATGGTVMTVVGTGTQVFRRLTREMSAYYLVAFEPDARDSDGRPHAITVRTRRKRVTVRAHRQFEIRAAGSVLTGPSALIQALRAPLPLSAVPMRVATYAFPDLSGAVRVAFTAEIGAGFTSPTAMDIAYALLDHTGGVVQARNGSAFLPLAPGGSGALDYAVALSLAPGEYMLKLAASDRAGRVGSIEHRVNARPASAGAIAISDPVITDAVREDSSRLPVRPVIRAGVLRTSLELRAAEWPARVTVRVEVARNETGDPILMAAASLANTPEPTKRIAYVQLDTHRLDAGTYALRAVVTTPQNPAGIVVVRSFEVLK